MIEIFYEYWCRECGEIGTTEERVHVCPHCESTNVFNGKLGKCRCGAEVQLDSFTNECQNCGALYNMSGQSLRPASEWEEDW